MVVDGRPLLGILLVGQPELLRKLDPTRTDLREVWQRLEVLQLLPLGNDLKSYLEHRTKAVNIALSTLIEESGIAELLCRLTITHPVSHGKMRATSLAYPLAVENFLTAALNMAAELGVPVVNRDVVRAV